MKTHPNRRPAHAGRAAPRMPFVALITGLVVGGMALLLLLNTASAANELRRHSFVARDQAIAAQLQELQNEVAASAAPGNLARAAAALGMVPALNPAFLVIGPDGHVRVLGHPGPASGMVLAAPPPAPHSTPATKPATTASTTARASDSKTASTTARASDTKTAGTTRRARQKPGARTSASATPTSTPTPTPTPTPTLTLPGGNR